MRTERVRAWPGPVEERWELLRDGEELGEPDSVLATRPTPPDGGFLGPVDIIVPSSLRPVMGNI